MALWVEEPETWKQGELQAYPEALEDQGDQWVQEDLVVLLILQVLLVLSAPVLPLVLVSPTVHPYQEVREDPGPLFHQDFQDGLKDLLNL